MFEEGVLSGIVAEVAGALHRPRVAESRPMHSETKIEDNNFKEMRQESVREQRTRMSATRQQLLEAVGRDAYNGVDLFEGTKPLSSPAPAPGASPATSGPLTGISADDKGVDITQLFGDVGAHWKAHMDSGK